MPLLQNNTGFFKAYFYTISTTILSSSKFQFVMEISKKKPFSYIRLELWVSEKKNYSKEREHIQKRISISRAGTRRTLWSQAGVGTGADVRLWALHYRPPGLCPCKEQHSLGSVRNLTLLREASLPKAIASLGQILSSVYTWGKRIFIFSKSQYIFKQNDRQEVSNISPNILTRRSRES